MNNIGIADLTLLKETYKGDLKEAYKLLKKNYPIQYLIGYVDFYNYKIKVNENVLIPRFETELLIDKSIKYLKKKVIKKAIDICTGSGCIAITLNKELNISFDACDISNPALTLAKENAKENNANIKFFKIDVLNDHIKEKYDLIVSNPPYVKKDEYTSLETKYEPQIALFANNNGLEFYEAIIKEAKNILNKKVIIIFEIGATIANDIKNIVLNYYPESNIIVEKDFNNLDRFMFIET